MPSVALFLELPMLMGFLRLLLILSSLGFTGPATANGPQLATARCEQITGGALPSGDVAIAPADDGPANESLRYRLLRTPQYLQQFSLLGDRILLRLKEEVGLLDTQLLSPSGKQKFAQLMESVDPLQVLHSLAQHFGIGAQQAEQMLFVDGEQWIKRMLEARNQNNWNEMIRIYENVLRGPWQNVSEAKLQAALAYNRRNQGRDRELALLLSQQVVDRAKASPNILSEAYGIRGRIFKDMYDQTHESVWLDHAIANYQAGFNANPMDYYPGVAAIELMLLKFDLNSSVIQSQVQRVQLATEHTLARYKTKNLIPDYWVLSTAMHVAVLRKQWDKVAQLLPSILVAANGPQNIQSSLQSYKRIEAIFNTDQMISEADKRRLHSMIGILQRAIESPDILYTLSDSSPSYVSVREFPDMEQAFHAEAFDVRQAVEQSGVETDLRELSKKGQANIESFHHLMQRPKGRANRESHDILLAPTGPYRNVIEAIAEQTDLIPWTKAYAKVGLELNPNYSEEFIERALKQGRHLYLLIPQDFRTQHAGSHTLNEFDILKNVFGKYHRQIHFVFGFESVYPLNYHDRLSAAEVEATYPDNIMRVFTERFQQWLISLGNQVRQYQYGNEFGSALYPLIYDQVLDQLTFHRQARRQHAHYNARGTPQTPAVILDLGGGTGLIARELIKSDPNRRVEIFDSSPSMLAEAEAQGIPRDQLHVSSILDLRRRNGQRVANNSADGATCSNVIYMLSPEEIQRFFKEVARVLKPGGILTLSSMAKASMADHQNFVMQAVQENQALEDRGLVPPGSSAILNEANKRLVAQNPTLLSKEEVIRYAQEAGLKWTGVYAHVYARAGFFMSFEKPRGN